MRNRTFLPLVASVAVAGLLLAACGDDNGNAADTATTTAAAPAETTAPAGENGGEQDIVDTAVAAGSFNTLASLLTSAGLVETLKGEGPFTVFAPTDEAFAAVDPATLEALGQNQEALQQVLTYHVVAGEVMSSDIEPGAVETVEGSEVTITVEGGMVMVNDATVTTADVEASNGVIHVIDSVLIPPDLEL
jgi:uncharacterized surface protein with fasciclin (FAS1) repeats